MTSPALANNENTPPVNLPAPNITFWNPDKGFPSSSVAFVTSVNPHSPV